MAAVSGALLDTYKGVLVHAPGQVFADLAVAITDGADGVPGIGVPGTGGRCSGREVKAPRRQGCLRPQSGARVPAELWPT